MLELISRIVLAYYLVMAAVLLIFLAWGYIDDRGGYTKRRRHAARTGDGAQKRACRESQDDPSRPARQNGPPSDNVVKFRRDK
jgi:hypothetical protein